MKIGFGQADITPRGGKVSLCGQFELRITDQVLDPLQAVAMIVESGGARSVWVSVDVIQVFPVTCRAAYEEILRFLPDLKEEEFVLSATHIHTGPALLAETYLSLTGDNSEPEEALPAAECNRQAALGIAEAVKQALHNLAEARVELAVARIQTGFNRRVCYQDGSAKMYGDTYAPDFLRMEGRDGGPTQILYVYHGDVLCGIVGNVPCTAQCDEAALYITADYWGVTRERINQAFGRNVPILALCRIAGDLSPHNLVDRVPMERETGAYWGRAQALSLGETVADAILRHQTRILASYEGEVHHAQGMRRVDFPVWQVTEKEYQWALDYIARSAGQSGGECDANGHPVDAYANGNAYTRKKRYESGDKTYPANIYGMALGDILLLSAPGEPYIEYADRIRMALPDQVVFDVQLTYDGMGYMATPRAVAAGHYSANIFNGVCGPDGGETLVKECVHLAKELTKK